MKAPSSCVILQAAGVAAAVAQAGHDQFTRQLRGGAPLAWDALHVPGGGAGVAAHKIAAVVALGHSSLLSSLAAAAGARHLPTSEISLFPPFAEIREIIPEMAFSRGILPPAGAAQAPPQRGVLAQETSWRPTLFLIPRRKHCGKPKKTGDIYSSLALKMVQVQLVVLARAPA